MQEKNLLKQLKKLIEALNGGGKSTAFASQMPTSPTQIMRQLAANAGQMGMPGGYTGAVQLPAFTTGTRQPASLMTSAAGYGQKPGMGEARFFQQSMGGGMAPISAMNPLGVPEKWNPLGQSGDIKLEIEKYIKDLQKGGEGGGSSADRLRAQYGWPAAK